MTTEDTIRSFIAEELNWHGPARELRDDRPLLAEHILDSFGLLQLVTFIEEDFGVAVGDEELVPEHFETIAAIAAFVAGKRAARPVA